MTSPRAATALALLAALTLPALAGPAGAEVAVPETVTGSGTASRFQVFAHGASIEGGLHERTIACSNCFVRVNLTASEVVAAQGGGDPEPLAPGVWEIRGFVGTFAYTQESLGVFDVEIHGAGSVHRVG